MLCVRECHVYMLIVQYCRFWGWIKVRYQIGHLGWHWASHKVSIPVDLFKDFRMVLNYFLCIYFFLYFNRYNIFKGENATLATFGAGFCSFDDSEKCVIYINLLDNAVLPIPTCLPDGTFVWPKSQYQPKFVTKFDSFFFLTVH